MFFICKECNRAIYLDTKKFPLKRVILCLDHAPSVVMEHATLAEYDKWHAEQGE